MALVKCKECGKDVSTQATACPSCGAPIKIHEEIREVKKPAERPSPGCLVIVLGVIVLGVIFAFMSGTGNSTDDKQTKKEEPICKDDDLQCFGNKGIVRASVYCKDPIEKLATHSVKWTDGTFELKFSRFRWHDKTKHEITYIGDKAEFQNGFGAYTPVIYQCDLAADSQTVLDVRVEEGRLP